jgi:phospholipid/cholesterol/gamma-HCH transport system permease protein
VTTYSDRYPHPPERRPTESFPIVQRTGIRFFRRITTFWRELFRQIGARSYFIRDTFRGFSEPGTFLPETLRQMRVIGVDSVPLAVLVAAFIGGVIALQTRYQLFEGVLLSVVGLATRQTIILEMGPLLTGLVMAGRVGARMTAEIGTMRVTEQIDALEATGVDSFRYLVVTRVAACLIAFPLLTTILNFAGILGGFVAEYLASGMSLQLYLQRAFAMIDFPTYVPSTMKTMVFGFIIATVSSYLGFNTAQGTEGVGRASTQSVVLSSILLIVVNVLLVQTIFVLFPGIR